MRGTGRTWREGIDVVLEEKRREGLEERTILDSTVVVHHGIYKLCVGGGDLDSLSADEKHERCRALKLSYYGPSRARSNSLSCLAWSSATSATGQQSVAYI
ncbi:hypothetical protein RRG08_044211 [Elysia crispata]|uniref:Uncharacterized protein n=1 Tax=Elysia crispata TaxID=231223 RepID=A0AAE1CNG1_9GAST|nr:hypothetical protein RRG08_044211 [Elysia crispata]